MEQDKDAKCIDCRKEDQLENEPRCKDCQDKLKEFERKWNNGEIESNPFNVRR